MNVHAPRRVLGSCKALSAVALLTAALLICLATATAARAGIQQEYGVFADCPLNNPAVRFCIVSDTTGGEFHIGSKTVPINKTITLQGGLETLSATTALVGAADGNTLSKTPLQLPGGLVGIELLPPLTEVNATAELVGPVSLNLTDFSSRTGTAVALPLQVKLDNPLLGGACIIGSPATPVAPQLTSGTTSPPAPGEPISGSAGTITLGGGGKIIQIGGASLVDNTFSAPGASGCGGLLSLIIDPSVNLIAGLPAGAGHNTAILNSEFKAAPARIVRVQPTLPEIGKCEKLAGKNPGGGYVDSGCTEGVDAKNGKFEWVPGPGAQPSFSGSGKAITLETVGGSQVRCLSSSTTGEYAGSKAATLSMTLTQCALKASKASCQSAGAGEGEIRLASLQGTLGFISDKGEGEAANIAVGLELEHEPDLFTAQCGPAKEALAVTGAVIGQVGSIDKMTTSQKLAFEAQGGKQLPGQFEGGPTATLLAKLGSSAAEEAALNGKTTLSAAKLEVRAAVH